MITTSITMMTETFRVNQDSCCEVMDLEQNTGSNETMDRYCNLTKYSCAGNAGLIIGAAIFPPIIVYIFPSLAIMGLILILIGFLFISVVGQVGLFKRNKASPFQIYKGPIRYLGTKFSGKENLLLALGVSVVVGGFFSVAVTLSR